MTSLRVLTWCCVILLAVMSLLPAKDMARTGLPGGLEHFLGSAAIATGVMVRAVAAFRSLADFGLTRPSWNTCNISRPAGIRRSQTSLCRLLEHSAAGSLLSSSYFSDPALAGAFVARWCIGYKVETAEGALRVREDEPGPRVGAGLHSTLNSLTGR